MTKITIERETLKWAIRWHESRIWPGPDEVSVFDALRAALAAQPADPIAARSRYETAYAGHQLPHTQTTTSEPVQRQKYVAKEAVMGWLYESQLRAEREAAQPAEPVAWINRRVIYDPATDSVTGYGEPELSFERASYGYDYANAKPLVLAQPAPAAVPPGMALVPIEPTPGIITTGTVALMKASDSDLDATREEIAATYRAMIAAAGDKP